MLITNGKKYGTTCITSFSLLSPVLAFLKSGFLVSIDCDFIFSLILQRLIILPLISPVTGLQIDTHSVIGHGGRSKPKQIMRSGGAIAHGV